jgi:cell division protein FtsQ
VPPAKSPTARARLPGRNGSARGKSPDRRTDHGRSDFSFSDESLSGNSLSEHSSSGYSRSDHSLHGLGFAVRVPKLGQFIPSGRSVLLGLTLLVLACGAYVVALETSVFAVQTIDVRGATPQIRAEARQALKGELGRSLLRVDGADLDRRLSTLPGIASLDFDRAFPNTLRVTIRAERPILVLRRGRDAFLVSTTGRVLRTLAHPLLSSLPRLWLPSHTQVTIGARLEPGAGQGAAVALAALRGASLPSSAREVQVDGQELTIVLASGFAVRLGDPGDIRLKLAIARRIFRAAAIGPTSVGYLDVSVPERPVLNTNSQVKG